MFPRIEEFARDLSAQGFPATPDDFFAAERQGKNELDEWLWPQICQVQLPRSTDPYYWGEYLRALMERIQAPVVER
jgi:hypothetical protein